MATFTFDFEVHRKYESSLNFEIVRLMISLCKSQFGPSLYKYSSMPIILLNTHGTAEVFSVEYEQVPLIRGILLFIRSTTSKSKEFVCLRLNGWSHYLWNWKLTDLMIDVLVYNKYTDLTFGSALPRQIRLVCMMLSSGSRCVSFWTGRRHPLTLCFEFGGRRLLCRYGFEHHKATGSHFIRSSHTHDPFGGWWSCRLATNEPTIEAESWIVVKSHRIADRSLHPSTERQSIEATRAC